MTATQLERLRSGWWAGTPTDTDIDHAATLVAHGDANKPNALKNVGSTEQRQRGYLAEQMFSTWLRQHGIPHTHDGGPNAEPDFMLGTTSVGVHCHGIRGTFKPDHLVFAFEQHIDRPDEWFMFGYEGATERLLLFGGASSKAFKTRARRYGAGYELVPGFVAAAPLYAVQIRYLELPDQWLTRICPEVSPLRLFA